MRLIDKDYVIGAMEESKKIHGEYSVSINNFISSLKSVPTIDAEPVKHGHWIKVGESCGIDILECSICHIQHPRLASEYCCDCGAKMDDMSEDV
ncbi:MAG: hypothetical protein MJ225_04835 [Bacilli bacterium]|nr:hypothetical protein [Bacilli bacterium]